jgi:hypothetical protein
MILVDLIDDAVDVLVEQGWRKLPTGRGELAHSVVARDGDITILVHPMRLKEGRGRATVEERIDRQLRKLVEVLEALRASSRGRLRLVLQCGTGPHAFPLPQWFLEECARLGVDIVLLESHDDIDRRLHLGK